MDFKNILFEKDGHIGVITINRPDALNALNAETINEFSACLDEIAVDTEIRVVIVTGAGRAFVARADIAELAECNAQSGQATAERGQTLFFKVEHLPQPVIAAVNGFALGGGCELAMACDIRLASEKAKFGQPEVSLGIIPGYGGTQRLARLIGYGKAKELIFTGEIFGVDEAYRIGLVDRVYPPDQLMEKAQEMATKIASRGPLAIKAAKEAINISQSVGVKSGCAHEAALFGVTCGTADQTEGMTAFLEKRTPEFRGE